MRMRKKGNLESRLVSCSDLITVADTTEKNMRRAAAIKEYLDMRAVFGNAHKVYLEIGCGKGAFAVGMAKLFPERNFLAVEKISNVLIAAAEKAKEENLKNLHFLNCAAEVLPKYVKDGEIAGIYLNFSNPLPKEGYKKQRLTHPRFLNMYRALLSPDGVVEQKTDDKDFYLFSLESYKEAGYTVLDRREDLAADPLDVDVETEHEARFKAAGKKIFYIKAKP